MVFSCFLSSYDRGVLPETEAASRRKIEEAKSLRLLIPVTPAAQLAVWEGRVERTGVFLCGVAANAMGVPEHVNYNIRQLLVDNACDVAYLRRHRKQKIPGLRKDLRENKR